MRADSAGSKQVLLGDEGRDGTLCQESVASFMDALVQYLRKIPMTGFGDRVPTGAKPCISFFFYLPRPASDPNHTELPIVSHS